MTDSTHSTTPLTTSGEARARSADALRGVKALLVEDSPFNQKIGVKMLSRAGSSVTVACNGEQCLRVLDEQGPFDVVLMDCHVCSALRTHCRLAPRTHTHLKFPRPE
jgi:PleD family two-component response regulator